MNMDEDEELYRLMNEEDNFYMGDDNKKANNSGCVGMLLFMLISEVFLTLGTFLIK